MGDFPNGNVTMTLEDAGDHMLVPPKETWPKVVEVYQWMEEALRKVVEINRTAHETHGGLKGLLGLTDDQVQALEDLVGRLD